MRCREKLAIETYLMLKQLGGEWEKTAEAADESELCRIGGRIRRARESGEAVAFDKIVRGRT